MTVLEIPSHEMDDTYTANGLHIAWRPTKFITPPTEPFGPQRVDVGAVLYLRDGTQTLATAEVTGSRRTLLDVSEDAADSATLWLPVLRALIDAQKAEHTAQVLDANLALMLDSWHSVNDPTVDPYMTQEEKWETVYACEALIRRLIPREDQVKNRLPEAVSIHAERLRRQARPLRAQALQAMPDPGQARPIWHQVGPYRPTRALEYYRRSSIDYYGDLPVQLLRGWNRMDLTSLSSQEITARRNYLVQWAIKRGVKKSEVAEASGIARTTIDRLLAAGDTLDTKLQM